MFVRLLLFFSILSCALAVSPIGLMTTSGPVRVSGSDLKNKAVSSWPILPGDEIVTEGDARAVLVAPETGRLEISEASRVTAEDDSIILHDGEVRTDRFTVHAGVYEAEPIEIEKKRNWFLVSTRPGRPVFAAYLGDLWVRAPETAPLLVRAGTYALPPEPASAASPRPPTPQTLYELSRSEGAAIPGAIGAAQAVGTGWTVGSLSHASSAALIAGVGASATAGTVAGVSLVEPQVTLPERSPSSSR